jgi:hypothetical protein
VDFALQVATVLGIGMNQAPRVAGEHITKSVIAVNCYLTNAVKIIFQA